MIRRLLLTAGAAAGIAGFAFFQQTQHSSGFLPPQTVLLQIAVLIGIWIGFLMPAAAISGIERAGASAIRRFNRICLLASALTFVILAMVNRHILLSFMNSGDEHSCYFMAQYLAAGKLWADPPALKSFFEVTHIGMIDGKWFSVYPPGWPLVWAAGLKLHLKDLLNPLLTALSIYPLMKVGEKIYGRGTALLFFPLLLVSPFFLLNGAAYYSHNLCLLQMTLFFYSVMKWRESSKAAWIVLAGFLLGFAAGTRYLTAAAMAFPVILWLLKILITEMNPRNLKAAFLFTFFFLILNAFHLYYNFQITGNFLNPPNHFLHSHEKLGFNSDYTPLTGLQYLYERFLYLIDWTPPGLVILFLFTLITARIHASWDLLLKGAVVLLPAGYFFYYSWGGNQYGPRYLFEAYPFLVLGVSGWLSAQWKKTPGSRKMLAGLVTAMLLASLPLAIKHLSFYRKATGERKAAYTLAESEVPRPAVVFLSGFLGDLRVMAPDDTARNSPFPDTSQILFVRDLGSENVKLAELFPNRHYYRISYDKSTGRPRAEKLTL